MIMILEIYIAVFAHTVSTTEVYTAERRKNPLKQLALNQSFPTRFFKHCTLFILILLEISQP